MELLVPGNREPRTGKFPLGLPPQGRHKGSGLSMVREGPSVPKRDLRSRHPAQASLLDTTWTVARARGPAAVQTWLRSSPGAADAPALGLAPLTCGGGRAQGHAGRRAGRLGVGEGGALKHRGSWLENACILFYFHSPLKRGPFGASDPTRHRPRQWLPRLEWPDPRSPWKKPPQPSCHAFLQPKIFL